MLTLDPRTVIFVNFAYTAFATIFAFVAWRRSKVIFNGIGSWVLSFLLLTLNFLILSLRGIIPVSIVIVLPHVLAAWAYIEVKRGLSKFYKIKNRIYTDFIIITIFTVLLLLNPSNARLRVVTVGLFPILIFLDTVILVLSSKVQEKIVPVTFFSLASIIQLLRAILGLSWKPGTNPMNTGNNLSTISILFFLTNLVLFFALFFMVIKAVLEQKSQLVRDLEKTSITDNLTQLNNRRGFIQIVEYESKRLKRVDSGFTIALGDIDHFKSVNDLYGHDCGDAVLKDVSKLLTVSLRETDTVARWGGEEFIILLPGSSIDSAFLVIERIRQAIESHDFSCIDKSINSTMSFGLSYTDKREFDLNDLTKIADKNLYKAKGSGRNRIVY